jgi:hypothetical protein
MLCSDHEDDGLFGADFWDERGLVFWLGGWFVYSTVYLQEETVLNERSCNDDTLRNARAVRLSMGGTDVRSEAHIQSRCVTACPVCTTARFVFWPTAN